MKKIGIILVLLFVLLKSQAQWDIANGIVDWTPDNSPGMPTASPNGPGFYHNVVIVASLNITISGGANVQDVNGDSNYPLCPGAKTTIIFSLSGGATFSGVNPTDAVSTSGDWESRFTWSYSLGKTVLTAVQQQVIPTNIDPGTFNTFNFNVLTPNYSSVFTFSTQVTKGTGTPDCRVSPGSVNDRDPNTTTSNDAQSINGFTNRSLPIQLFQLNSLSKKTSGLNVEWKTLNESNTDYFEVYRMYEGNQSTWMKVGKVDAAGESHKELTYTYTDNSYAKAQKIYYRIKQVDQSGSSTYTDIKGIELKENSKVQISGFPNPIRTIYHVAFNSPSDAPIQIEVIDLLGRIAFKQKVSAVKGYNQYDLEMKDVAAGTYFVKVYGKEINQSLTVVKTE